MTDPHEVGDPIATAVEFANRHAEAGFALDFFLASLQTEIDRLLEQPIFHRGRAGMPTAEEAKEEVAISAYVGETVRRLFRGKWSGEFHLYSNAHNYYTSFVELTGFRYWPSHFISYRLTNGPADGSFAQHLELLLPEIKAGASEEEPGQGSDGTG